MSKIIKVSVEQSLESKQDLVLYGVYDNSKMPKLSGDFCDETVNYLSRTFKSEKNIGKDKKKINCYLDGKLRQVCLYGLGEFKDSDNTRSLGAGVVKYANSLKVETIAIDVSSFKVTSSDHLQGFIEGLILGSYEFLDYKKDEDGETLKTVTLIGKVDKKIVEKAISLGSGVAFARDLSNHPPNILTPTYIANEAVKIAKSNSKMSSKIIDVSKFQKLGLGSFYGVAMGAHEPAKMILVEYNGGKKSDKPLALVGKGLTFDSGGISIKPSPKMDEMKFDMCGSATVMGVLKAVAELQPKINIIFAIGSTENMPGGKAQRPGDIVTAYNGKTIEVLNTDAEGRLVLADVLAYVNKNYKPKEILDFATLTGAVLVALGDRASGIMGNNSKLLRRVEKASKKTGEKVWELPMWEEYSKDIKSKVADIKNLGRMAGTIAGGVFLQEFVDDTPWCHLDIAGTAWGPKEPGYQPEVGATGVGVRLVYRFIEDSLK